MVGGSCSDRRPRGADPGFGVPWAAPGPERAVGVVADPSGAAGWELLVVGRAGAGAAVPEAAQSAPRRRALSKVPPRTMARNGPDGL